MDVEEGGEAAGVESSDASSRCKSRILKEIQKRASKAREQQQQSCHSNKFGTCRSKGGTSVSNVVSKTRATSMDEEPTPYQPPDLEASNTMDVSPHQGPAAPVDTIC